MGERERPTVPPRRCGLATVPAVRAPREQRGVVRGAVVEMRPDAKHYLISRRVMQRSLLRRAQAQLEAWQRWYGELDSDHHGTIRLPPAGDVQLADDIDEYLKGDPC